MMPASTLSYLRAHVVVEEELRRKSHSMYAVCGSMHALVMTEFQAMPRDERRSRKNVCLQLNESSSLVNDPGKLGTPSCILALPHSACRTGSGKDQG